MKDENSFLSLADFRERFDIKTNFITFHGIVSVLKAQRELLRKKDKVLPDSRFNGSFTEKFLRAKKPNKIVYDKLIALKQIFPRSRGSQRIVSINYLFGRPLIPYDFLKGLFTSNFRDLGNLRTSVFGSSS